MFTQDPNQKEDDLSAVHVKQGFTTSYINLSTSDEYGSALSKAAQLQPSKIWNSFKDILVKKEELNTFQESKDKSKRQPINIRDDFWLVTGKTKNLCDKYFKELAGDKDYRYLAKKVPIFNKNEDILIKLVECEVPCSRGVWLIKMHAAYKAAMQEANKSKHKRSTVDPCIEWTLALTRYHWTALISVHKYLHQLFKVYRRAADGVAADCEQQQCEYGAGKPGGGGQPGEERGVQAASLHLGPLQQHVHPGNHFILPNSPDP